MNFSSFSPFQIGSLGRSHTVPAQSTEAVVKAPSSADQPPSHSISLSTITAAFFNLMKDSHQVEFTRQRDIHDILTRGKETK